MSLPHIPCTKASVSTQVLTLLRQPTPKMPTHAPKTKTPSTPKHYKHICPIPNPTEPTTPFIYDPTTPNGPKTPYKRLLKLATNHSSFPEFIPFANTMLLTLNQSSTARLTQFFSHSYEFFAYHKIHLISIHLNKDPRCLELYFPSRSSSQEADDLLDSYCEYFSQGKMRRWEGGEDARKVVINDVPVIQAFGKSEFVFKRSGWTLDGKYSEMLRGMNGLVCGCDYRVREIQCWVDGRRVREQGVEGSCWVVVFSDRFVVAGVKDVGLNFFGYRGGVVVGGLKTKGRGWGKEVDVDVGGGEGKGREEEVKGKLTTVVTILKRGQNPDGGVGVGQISSQNRFEALRVEE